MEKMIGGCVCTICTDEVDADTNCLQAIRPCGHVFHEHCLKGWTQLGLSTNPSASCPICNHNYKTTDVLGLYFSDASRTEVSHSLAPQHVSDRYRARAEDYQKTIRKLEADSKASMQKRLEVERKGQEYLEELEVVRAQVSKEREENSRLAISLARAQAELRENSGHSEELVEKGVVMAEILADYKLATDRNMKLSDAKMSTLIYSSKDSVRKDDIIFVLSKVLDIQMGVCRELMQKCQDPGMGEFGAGRESGKLIEQDERMNSKMQGQIAKSEKENGEGRYFTRGDNKPVGFSYSDTAYKRPRPSPNDVHSGPINASPSRPQSKSRKVDGSEAVCRPSLASVHPNVICHNLDRRNGRSNPRNRSEQASSGLWGPL